MTELSPQQPEMLKMNGVISSKCQGKITEPGFHINSNYHLRERGKRKIFPDLQGLQKLVIRELLLKNILSYINLGGIKKRNTRNNGEQLYQQNRLKYLKY